MMRDSKRKRYEKPSLEKAGSLPWLTAQPTENGGGIGISLVYQGNEHNGG